MGDLCALLPAIPHDDQALPRHPRQARHLCPRAGGALCAQGASLCDKQFLFSLQPLFWEWTWLLSIPVTFFGLSATKTTNLKAIKQFLIGTLVTADDIFSSPCSQSVSIPVVLLAADPGRDGRPLLRLLRVLDRGSLRQRVGVARLPLLRPLVRLLLRCTAGKVLTLGRNSHLYIFGGSCS